MPCLVLNQRLRAWPGARCNNRHAFAPLSPSSETFQQRLRGVFYSHTQASSRFSDDAASSVRVSARCTPPPASVRVVSMPETSGDSGRGVSRFIFWGIQDSFTTQE